MGQGQYRVLDTEGILAYCDRMRSSTSMGRFSATLACLSLAVGEISVAGWPTYHGGFALTGMATDTFADKPVRLWRTRLGKGPCSSVVGGDGRLFCISDQREVNALDYKGRKLWTRRFRGDMSADPARSEKSFEAPPLYASTSLLVVAAIDGTVYGLSPADGKTRWTYTADSRIQGGPNFVPDAGSGPDRVLIMTQSSGILHALSAVDGGKLWVSDPMERTDGHIAVWEGQAVFGNCASTFFAIDVRTGKQVAAIEVEEGAEMAGGLAVSQGHVFGGNRSGSLVSADLRAGKVRWVMSMSEVEGFATPAVSRSLIVFSGGDAVVYCLKRESGDVIWKYDTAGKQALSPVIAADHVLAAVDGTLFGLNLKDGHLVWKLHVSDEITAPSIVGGVIVVGMDDGHVAAYGRRDKE